MPVSRRFLIAPSLTRLIRKECGLERVTEGHFAPQSGRQAQVRLEQGRSYLVLTSLEGNPEAAEDRTELPTLHAEALLAVCPGRVTFERSVVRLAGQDALVDRFVIPGQLDLVSVDFAAQAEAAAFVPPVWFGGEVTHDDTYLNRVMALSGLPHAPETPLSNAALDAVLDAVEGRPGTALSNGAEPRVEGASEEDSTFEVLRRLAVVTPADSVPDPSKAEPKPAEAAAANVAEIKARRSVLDPTSDRYDDGEERLAGVLESLSEALSQSPSEKESRLGADLKAQPAWRWSSH